MKKIILLIILILVSGCNYQEIDSLAVVSSLAIDYNKENYQLTLEIKEVKEKGKVSSYIIDTKGKTIDEAVKKANETFHKNLYFANLDILLLTPKALDKIDVIMNYINNDYDFTFNFNIALVNSPNKLMKLFIDENYIFGDYIINTIKKKSNNKYDIIYHNFLSNYLKNVLIIPKISIVGDDISFSLVRGNYE